VGGRIITIGPNTMVEQATRVRAGNREQQVTRVVMQVKGAGMNSIKVSLRMDAPLPVGIMIPRGMGVRRVDGLLPKWGVCG